VKNVYPEKEKIKEFIIIKSKEIIVLKPGACG
jgi:hypothetical protein